MKGCTKLNETKTKWIIFTHPKHTGGSGKLKYHFYIMEMLVGGTTQPLSNRSQKRTHFSHICFYVEMDFSRIRYPPGILN